MSKITGSIELGLVHGQTHGTKDKANQPAEGDFIAFTASNGTIRYPINHVSNFTDTGLDRSNYNGTQNTNPGILNGAEWEDFSTASFYSVNVANTDNILRVERGKLDVNSKGNIS